MADQIRIVYGRDAKESEVIVLIPKDVAIRAAIGIISVCSDEFPYAYSHSSNGLCVDVEWLCTDNPPKCEKCDSVMEPTGSLFPGRSSWGCPKCATGGILVAAPKEKP